MEQKDIPAVHRLLSEYLRQFCLTPVMNEEEVEHWFLPQVNIIDTFVVEVRHLPIMLGSVVRDGAWRS